MFEKQLRALARANDVLMALSTSGESANVMAAMRSARALGIPIVALTGDGGGRMAALLNDRDVHISVPHRVTARIQDVHLLALHCMCDGIEAMLSGKPQANDEPR